MTEVEADQLHQAVEAQHGGTATLVQSVPVDERHDGRPVSQGVVHVFDLAGHPKAKRAYAWSSERDDGKRRFYAVLHLGPVTGPVEAVRAAIVAEARNKTVGLSVKSLRKIRRKTDNEAYAKEARFWRKEGSALQLGYNKPINKHAAKDLDHKPPKKR